MRRSSLLDERVFATLIPDAFAGPVADHVFLAGGGIDRGGPFQPMPRAFDHLVAFFRRQHVGKHDHLRPLAAHQHADIAIVRADHVAARNGRIVVLIGLRRGFGEHRLGCGRRACRGSRHQPGPCRTRCAPPTLAASAAKPAAPSPRSSTQRCNRASRCCSATLPMRHPLLAWHSSLVCLKKYGSTGRIIASAA